MLKTTAGRLVIKNALPDDMQEWGDKPLDKKAVTALLSELARKHPEKYRDVSHDLLQIASRNALESGSNSFGLKHIRVSPVAMAHRKKLQIELSKIDDDDTLSDEKRNARILSVVSHAKYDDDFSQQLLDEATKENSPLARMITSGARGSKESIASLRGGDLLYVDSKGDPLALPITRSYGEGLTPAQYWAGAFGARQGLIAAKLGTQVGGFLAKRLAQGAHRLLVTGVDEDFEPGSPQRGMPVALDDAESEGSLLAHSIGGYARNTVLTPKIIGDLKRQGLKRILIRSPIVGGARDGGLLARDVGVRETGHLPHTGSLVGLSASQSISERLSQGLLGAKHLGGIAGKGVEQLTQGFPLVSQLIDIPKEFPNGAAHSQEDGVVSNITDAPAGGKYVSVNNIQHYVPNGLSVTVASGDKIEAGDVLSSGIPNPSEIVKHKGIGEGRRYFTTQLQSVLKGAGVNAHRRNVELMARALVDHIRLTDERDDWLPGDIVSYQALERDWRPRHGTQDVDPRQAVGKYLEAPVLHYTVGTKIKPSMLNDFNEFGIKNLSVHEQPPPFEPVMIRSQDVLHHDPDFITKMYGSGLKKNLLHDVHRGGVSSEEGTSFVPGLAKGIDFGIKGKVRFPTTKMGEEFEKEASYLSDYWHYLNNPSEMYDQEAMENWQGLNNWADEPDTKENLGELAATKGLTFPASAVTTGLQAKTMGDAEYHQDAVPFWQQGMAPQEVNEVHELQDLSRQVNPQQAAGSGPDFINMAPEQRAQAKTQYQMQLATNRAQQPLTPPQEPPQEEAPQLLPQVSQAPAVPNTPPVPATAPPAPTPTAPPQQASSQPSAAPQPPAKKPSSGFGQFMPMAMEALGGQGTVNKFLGATGPVGFLGMLGPAAMSGMMGMGKSVKPSTNPLPAVPGGTK